MKTKKHTFYLSNTDGLSEKKRIISDFFRIITSFAVLSAILCIKNVAEKTFPDIRGRVAGEFLYISAYIVSCACLYVKRKKSVVQVRQTPPPTFSLLLSVVCFFFATLFSFMISKSGIPFSSTFSSRHMSDSPVSIFTLIMLHAVIPGLFEEMYFRFLLTGITHSYGTVCSMILSSVLFSAAHFGGLGDTIYSLGAGILLWILYHLSGKIIYPVITHTLINTFAVISSTLSESQTATAMVILSFFSIVASITVSLPRLNADISYDGKNNRQ